MCSFVSSSPPPPRNEETLHTRRIHSGKKSKKVEKRKRYVRIQILYFMSREFLERLFCFSNQLGNFHVLQDKVLGNREGNFFHVVRVQNGTRGGAGRARTCTWCFHRASLYPFLCTLGAELLFCVIAHSSGRGCCLCCCCLLLVHNFVFLSIVRLSF